MKKRPILFSAPMVRAILDGRKTQTRRIVKFPPAWDKVVDTFKRAFWIDGPDSIPGWAFTNDAGRTGKLGCPYGQPGDRLWVKETFAHEVGDVLMSSSEQRPVGSKLGLLAYRADHEVKWPPVGKCWRPSIFMRREYSRITLEIVSIRVERLQKISEDDAVAEGIDQDEDLPDSHWKQYGMIGGTRCPIASYQTLWESINGAGSWAKNPWVWVVEFRKQ